jgi:hypothetical protein
MAIKQFNAGWSKVEDRITLSLNTSEGELYRFWITRFIAMHILEGVQSIIQKDLEIKHNARASQVIHEFQKDAIKKQLDFTEEFQGGGITPLGDNPVLVIGLNLSLKNNLVTVGLQLVTKQTASFDLAPGQLQSLLILLENLVSQANWKLETNTDSPIMSSSEMDHEHEHSKKLH